MKAVFWRLAYRHYQGRRPLLLADIAAFTWFTFFALGYGAALAAGWTPGFTETAVGLALVGVPLVIGVLHCRIRIEANKSPDGLYRKMVQASRRSSAR